MLLHCDLWWRRRARSSPCRSSSSGSCPRRRARSCCRGSPGYSAPRSCCCSARRSMPARRHARPRQPRGRGERLLEEARALALRLAQQPAGALRATKRLLRGDPAELLARMDAEVAEFSARTEVRGVPYAAWRLCCRQRARLNVAVYAFEGFTAGRRPARLRASARRADRRCARRDPTVTWSGGLTPRGFRPHPPRRRLQRAGQLRAAQLPGPGRAARGGRATSVTARCCTAAACAVGR